MAYVNKYIYIYSDILSGMYSDILSGDLSGIHSDILSDLLSDIVSGIHIYIYSDILSGILSGMCSGPGVPRCLQSLRAGLGPGEAHGKQGAREGVGKWARPQELYMC